MEYWSVDRLEGTWAVCEDPSGQRRELPLDLLPPGTREGDCFVRGEDGVCRPAPEETARRRRQNAILAKSLFED